LLWIKQIKKCINLKKEEDNREAKLHYKFSFF
jgi:hypothetical protein